MLSVAHWGHEAKHKLLKKLLHIGDNVAHWGVAHWVHSVYFQSELQDSLQFGKNRIFFNLDRIISAFDRILSLQDRIFFVMTVYFTLQHRIFYRIILK